MKSILPRQKHRYLIRKLSLFVKFNLLLPFSLAFVRVKFYSFGKITNSFSRLNLLGHDFFDSEHSVHVCHLIIINLLALKSCMVINFFFL